MSGSSPRPGDVPPDKGTTAPSLADELVLILPAESVYVAVLRMATASLATRCDLTIDTIDDLRIAVDEASAILLHRAVPGEPLRCVLTISGGRLRAIVSVRVDDTAPPDPSSLGWLVLTALVGEVEARLDGDVMAIELSHPLDG